MVETQVKHLKNIQNSLRDAIKNSHETKLESKGDVLQQTLYFENNYERAFDIDFETISTP